MNGNYYNKFQTLDYGLIELKEIPSQDEINRIKQIMQEVEKGRMWGFSKSICEFHNRYLQLKPQSLHCAPCIAKAAVGIKKWLAQIEIPQQDNSTESINQ